MANTSFEDLPRFSEALSRIPLVTLDLASKALNRAAEYAREEGVNTLAKRYNLERSYIESNLNVRGQASRTDLTARIVGNNRAVLAPRYGARPKTVGAPGAKGNAKAGIPAGQKGAGSTAWSVLRGGGGKSWERAFFIRLPGSGAWALVARYGSGYSLSSKQDWKKNLDVVNSLSVGQMWRYERDQVAPQAMALASEFFLEGILKEL
jgi:hypothetical protein